MRSLVENKPDVCWIKKDWAELECVMKGSTPEYLEEERDLLLDQITQAMSRTKYRLAIGVGNLKQRMADIYQSFVEALVGIQDVVDGPQADSKHAVDRAELLKVDKSAIENYLRCGIKEGFDEFFEAYLQPLGEPALRSYLIKDYLFVDVVVATAKLVNELGGDVDQVIPELNSIETILANVKTVEQLREQAHNIIISALAFRDSQTNSQYTGMIRQTKVYVDQHYMDPNLSLNEVDSQAHRTPSHFRAVFSQETCQNLKEYMTEIRIQNATEL